jgi:hypothetical protein
MTIPFALLPFIDIGMFFVGVFIGIVFNMIFAFLHKRLHVNILIVGLVQFYLIALVVRMEQIYVSSKLFMFGIMLMMPYIVYKEYSTDKFKKYMYSPIPNGDRRMSLATVDVD